MSNTKKKQKTKTVYIPAPVTHGPTTADMAAKSGAASSAAAKKLITYVGEDLADLRQTIDTNRTADLNASQLAMLQQAQVPAAVPVDPIAQMSQMFQLSQMMSGGNNQNMNGMQGGYMPGYFPNGMPQGPMPGGYPPPFALSAPMASATSGFTGQGYTGSPWDPGASNYDTLGAIGIPNGEPDPFAPFSTNQSDSASFGDFDCDCENLGDSPDDSFEFAKNRNELAAKARTLANSAMREGDHKKAASLHLSAANLHIQAAKINCNAGRTKLAAMHAMEAQRHGINAKMAMGIYTRSIPRKTWNSVLAGVTMLPREFFHGGPNAVPCGSNAGGCLTGIRMNAFGLTCLAPVAAPQSVFFPRGQMPIQRMDNAQAMLPVSQGVNSQPAIPRTPRPRASNRRRVSSRGRSAFLF